MINSHEVLRVWSTLPDSVKERKACEDELLDFEDAYVVIPAEYRWFLLNCGGGAIGGEWVDGIHTLPATHDKFRHESKLENGWKIKGFVIGWDGAGNPLVIDINGRVMVEDHNNGSSFLELFSSFSTMLKTGLKCT